VGTAGEAFARNGVAVTPAEGGEAQVLVTVPRCGVDLEAIERALIRFALEHTGGNRTRAARFLRLTRSALLYRMQKHGLVSSRQPRGPAGPDERRRPA
jgi:DNA-binding NtrC family response regulator